MIFFMQNAQNSLEGIHIWDGQPFPVALWLHLQPLTTVLGMYFNIRIMYIYNLSVTLTFPICMCTKNLHQETDFLGECVASIIDFVDEPPSLS